MDIVEIRAAFELLGFERPIKDEGRVKVKYRALVLANNSDHADHTGDAAEKAARDAKIRAIQEAKAICIAFCVSPLSEEELEEAGRLEADAAHEQYMKMVQLFIGRIIQHRFRYWTRVRLTSERAIPEFGPEVPKFPLVSSTKKIGELLSTENNRPNVRWVLSFEVNESETLAWVVMEMIDGTLQALVLFTTAPGTAHALPEQTKTAITMEAVTQLLHEQGLRKIRGVRGSSFWGEFANDPWQIQVTGSGAVLCWITLVEGNLTPIGFYWANSVEEFQAVLPRWVARVKAETWDSPL